ncbi:RHS repeat-associated core domain-containing protein, partial [Streptomyces sp. TM32]|uniref:RHS repeat-associated core domain-containing protein n=1 Tax=Streptomyces sp. TM32 TaxID=1652669 RepID=UPI001026ACBF
PSPVPAWRTCLPRPPHAAPWLRLRLLGTPTELVDTATDTVAWRTVPTLWGNTTWAADSTTTTPLRFPGQYYDPETRLHYNLNRYYDPETARYTTPDPLGLSPAPNPNAYVHNPHTWCDPIGLMPDDSTDLRKELMDLGKQRITDVAGTLKEGEQAPGAYSVGRDRTTGKTYYGESGPETGHEKAVTDAMPAESQHPTGRPPGVCGEPRMFTNAIKDGRRGSQEHRPGDRQPQGKEVQDVRQLPDVGARNRRRGTHGMNGNTERWELEALRNSLADRARFEIHPLDIAEARRRYEEEGFEFTAGIREFLETYGEFTVTWSYRFGETFLTTSVEETMDSAHSLPRSVSIFGKRIGRPVVLVGTATDTQEAVLLADNSDVYLAGDAGIQRVANGFGNAVRALVAGDWDKTFF